MRRIFPLILAACAVICLAVPAAAQQARAMGTVKDTDGKPIKGASIRAVNSEAIPSQIVATSDDRGRWAMIGLRSGEWQFITEAPGFTTVTATAQIRVAASPPLTITMARDPGPIPDALASNIQAQLTAANLMRDQGRLDQAITAYRDIRAKNPKLTSLNIVIGDTYRKKAAQETDATTKRSLLELAIESYGEALKSDADNSRAKIQLEATRADAAALSN